MVEPIFEYQFRLILIGDSTVGKSSLLRSFTEGKFAEISDPTVGVDFFARLIDVDPGRRIKLQLWDTAGQEKFRSITTSYYRNSVGALLVYDISNRSSFENIPKWMNEACRHIDHHHPVFVLVGCKLDLIKADPEARQVTTEEAKEFAQNHGFQFLETSARSGFNVERAFRIITQDIYDKVQSGEFTIENGWDGIKSGYGHSSGRDYDLEIAEPARTSCC